MKLERKTKERLYFAWNFFLILATALALLLIVDKMTGDFVCGSVTIDTGDVWHHELFGSCVKVT